MKRSWILIILSFVAVILTIAFEAEAATARVRCRVRPDRLRIQVDGQDLAAGTYFAKVSNGTTSVDSKTQTAPPPDLDFDFDSTAGPNDMDTFIPLEFAKAGDRVTADIINSESGDIVASASKRCREK